MTTTYQTRSIDGVDIFYREAGPADAPTLVLLHGFPSSSHMFRDLMPLLADRFHLIAPDYPGFGQSASPATTEFAYTFDHLADVMDHFLADLGVTRYALYMQDYGGPVGLRLATRHPEAITALIVQNANAYAEGISAAFEPLQPFWANWTSETEGAARSLLTRETTMFQYQHGVQRPAAVSPDAWLFDQMFLDRPGNDAIQLALLHDYPANVALYPVWHTYLREQRPPTLVVWGQNDPFFTVAGAEAFSRDQPAAKIVLLNTGHFALEEEHAAIADHIRRFLS